MARREAPTGMQIRLGSSSAANILAAVALQRHVKTRLGSVADLRALDIGRMPLPRRQSGRATSAA